MKRIRAVGIVVQNDQVLLIERRNTLEYFVFPGGGVENEETVEQAVIRELREETTIEVKIKKLLYCHMYDDDTEQYFYLCEYIGGEPKLAHDAPEIKQMAEGNDFYNPAWYKIEDLKTMLVFPLEIRDLLLEDIKNNFSNPVNTLTIKVSELRRKI
ncbi:MAG: NUDIX domain-containing protein [bacterium]